MQTFRFVFWHLTGGFALAASWVWGADHEIVSFCEIEPFAQKVLKKHWPDVPCIPDIRDIKGTDYAGTIDLISGGFPCQPYSVAGKRKGAEDDRALWPEMLRVIKEAKPNWIIGENVAGIESVFQWDGFSELEGKEYPTKKAAKADFKGISERTGEGMLWVVLGNLEKLGYEVQPVIIPACAVNAPHRRDRVWIVANSKRPRTGDKSRAVAMQGRITAETGPAALRQGNGETLPDRVNTTGQDVAHPISKHDDISGHGASEVCRERSEKAKIQGCSLADDNRNRCDKRRKSISTTGGNGTFRENGWLPEPAVGRVANGVSGRVDRLKGLGNAIVPQVVVPIMQAIKEINETS